MTSAGGRETILVVCSEQPLPDLEEAVARFPPPAPGGPPVYAELAPAFLDNLRGIGGTSPSHDQASLVSAARPGERLRELERRITDAGLSGVFARTIPDRERAR